MSTIVTDLENALERLECALSDAHHPLAARRPAGRRAEDLSVAADQRLSIELPQELQALWGWWGGTEYWPNEVEPSRSPFGDLLPGGITIESLEQASDRLRLLRDAELIPHDVIAVIPIAYLGDIVGHLWCDLRCAEDGRVPVAVHYADEPPPFEPHWRFASIADWVNAMAELLESGTWTESEGLSWHFAADHQTWIL